MRYLGIDNGITGGYAIVEADGASKRLLKAFKTPITYDKNDKATVDVKKLANEIGPISIDFAVIELAHAMPGQGVSSMFSFGKTYGINLAILSILGIRHVIASPRSWQKELFGQEKPKDTKKASIDFANAEYGMKLRHNQHGISDAVCMAEYALRIDGKMV